MRIEGIRGVDASAVRRLLEGAPVRGTRLLLELDETRFASAGDAFLFACVVDEVLAARASLNTFSQLSVRLQPSQRGYAWPSRSGARVLL
jgi:type VI secretion system protein ImpG